MKSPTTYQEAVSSHAETLRVARPGKHDRTLSAFFPYLRKDGKNGTKRLVSGAWFTPLFTCETCKVAGSPRKVCDRSDVWGWYGEYDPDLGKLTTLCVSCWNKVKPIRRMENKLKVFEKLLRQVDKTRLQIRRK